MCVSIDRKVTLAALPAPREVIVTCHTHPPLATHPCWQQEGYVLRQDSQPGAEWSPQLCRTQVG